MTEILLGAYDYLDELRNNPKYQEYIKINQEIKIIYKKDYEKLAKAKQAFEEVFEYGSNHPSFKELASNYSLISKELFSKPELKKQLRLNNEIEIMINDFLKQVVNEISPNIPVLNEFGFVSLKKGGNCGYW